MEEMKEKKSGNAVKIIIPIVVGIVMVLILLAVAVATRNLGKNPRKTLANAVDKTFSMSGDAIEEAWQMDGYTDMFKDEQMHIDADIDFSGLGTMEIRIDKDKERYGMLMGVGYYGVSIIEANLYIDEEEMRLGIPEVTDDVFYVNFATFNEDIETFIENYDIDDDLADELRALGEELQNMDAKGNARGNGKGDSQNDEALTEAFEQLVDAAYDLYAKAEITEADSKDLMVNGRKRSCMGYVVTIDDTKIAEYFRTYKEIYENNEAFRNYLNQVMIATTGNEAEYDLILEAFDILSDACLEAGDLQIYCYIYDDVLAQIYFENGDMFFEWNICGGNFPLENMDLTVAYGSEEFVIKRSGSLDGSDYEAEYQISVDDEELIFTAECDKESGDFRFELEEEYYFSMLLEGNIEKTVHGSEYTITIDTFKVNDREILYGDITVSNECGEIEVPEGDLHNVLEMTEDDWYDILGEISYYLY
ncbi:MAG: hypothetical protein HDQ97_03290 [Lachnospiraceae bacterium]|nr:hypothetical protein [Lachnospiraceae bacterium]